MCRDIITFCHRVLDWTSQTPDRSHVSLLTKGFSFTPLSLHTYTHTYTQLKCVVCVIVTVIAVIILIVIGIVIAVLVVREQ